MHNTIVGIRNKALGLGYRGVARPLFFAQDPEKVHDRMLTVASFAGRHAVMRDLSRAAFTYSHPMLRQGILGIDFKNPIGLAAGFDKDAVMTDILPDVGFGWEEIGSVTGEFCPGNEGTRLWRLKQSKSIVVYYGLKNEGSEAIADKLKDKDFRIPICASIAKTNSKKTASDKAGIADYVKAFQTMEPIGDLFTINISCPNAYGGQPFTDGERLDKLLSAVDKVKTDKPVFIKLSPDLDDKTLNDLLDVIDKHRIHGIICTNLTKKRDNPAIKEAEVPDKGGLSGKVVEGPSNDLLEKVARRTKGKYVLVGLGGIFTAEDAYKKIKLGASLIQLITGMIYEGPQAISEINRGLVKLLKADGYSHISEAVGADVK
ncbi:MAG: quinone-dependent dihydroorotate dehydrogenase [Candidatus Saccharimonadales bacterium]|nr:quinone-dependent dihydroorotate dehydrogenase [Candidatus Saccharimonadales bacterium]